MLNLPWQGFEIINFTKIETNAGMAERLVIDLAIEEALQEEVKHTLEHNNQSYGEWCVQCVFYFLLNILFNRQISHHRFGHACSYFIFCEGFFLKSLPS